MTEPIPFAGWIETDNVTVTLPREQWEAVVKAINLACHVEEIENNRHIKELSDEEITQCLNESMETKNMWGQPMSELNPVKFARAILNKASEK